MLSWLQTLEYTGASVACIVLIYLSMDEGKFNNNYFFILEVLTSSSIQNRFIDVIFFILVL